MEPNTEKLFDMAISAHDILFSSNTVFPFTLFPDTISLDREKVTIIHRYFFFTAKIAHIRIKDILSVDADVGPFFGSLHITSRYFVNTPQKINFLPRSKALQLERQIQGYIIASQREIDCSTIPKDDLLMVLEDLGRGATEN